jgi:tetratricopeptide (TPR) repeat protein
VADFGLAKVLEGPGGGTRTGAIMGTPRYMSPEQLSDSKAVDARSDVFALGAILYELVCGRPAFQGRSTLELFQRITMGQHAPLPEDLDPLLASLIRRALAVEPGDRIPSAEAFLEGLPREPSNASWGSSWGAEPPAGSPRVDATWTASVERPGGEPTLERPAPAPAPPSASDATLVQGPGAPPRRRWPVVGMAVGAVVMLSLAAAVGWPRASVPQGFTAAAPPSLQDPDADRLLGLVWHAVEHDAGDLEKLLGQAAASGMDEPAFALVEAFRCYPVDAAGLREALGEAVASARGGPGPVAELLVALHDAERAAEDAAWVVPVLQAHLARWPEDRLARMWWVKAMQASPSALPLDEAFVRSVVDEAPDHELSHILAVTAYRSHGRFEEADALGREAMSRGVRSAWLLSELAVNAQQRGRFQEAVDYGSEALRLEPGSWPPRLHAAMGAAQLGDMETFERLVAPMRGDESPVGDRRRFAFFVARGLATLGQLERSATWAAIAREAAEGSDAQQTLVRIAAMEVEMRLHAWIGEDDDLAAHLAVLDRAVADPTLPAAGRHAPGLVSVLAHGLLAARAGEDAAARRALGRLDGDHADRLAVALARAVGQPAPDVSGCHGQVDAAAWSWERGDVERAVRLATQAEETCPHTDSQPFALAQAVRALGGEDGALERHRGTWRRPDAGLDVVKRLTAAGLVDP